MIGLGLGGICGWSGYRVMRGIMTGGGINWGLFQWCFNGLPLVDKLDRILDNKTYIVLLQNNNELRPSGGFMGSYAKLRFDGGLKQFEVQDIYVPDGQLVGHVDPPAPINQAFGQGWWKLRDSNWDVDFASAAATVDWFFEQGGERADGVVAVNLGLVQKWLGVIGPIEVIDYGEVVSHKNIWTLAQKHAEENFFPGSTQKKDFLGAVGGELFEKTRGMGPMRQIRLMRLIYDELKRGQILVWMEDVEVQKEIEERKWGGRLGRRGGDYLYIVETNLGANKANCCVTREVTQEVDGRNERLEIRYQNKNEFVNPKPPVFWGGNYVNYLRVVVPGGAVVKSVYVDERMLEEKVFDGGYGIQEDRYVVEKRGEFKIIGFWVITEAQKSTKVEIEYTSPLAPLLISGEGYRLVVRRQTGVESFPYRLVYNGKLMVNEEIDRDKEFGQWTK